MAGAGLEIGNYFVKISESVEYFASKCQTRSLNQTVASDPDPSIKGLEGTMQLGNEIQ
jgi:hypothetical protein